MGPLLTLLLFRGTFVITDEFVHEYLKLLLPQLPSPLSSKAKEHATEDATQSLIPPYTISINPFRLLAILYASF